MRNDPFWGYQKVCVFGSPKPGGTWLWGTRYTDFLTRLLLSFTFLLSACADPDPCATMRDISLSAASLSLTRNEHPGWGNPTCFQCHQRFSIHQNDCTAVAEVDAAAIDAMIDPADTTTCIQCHGSNGVAAWAHFEDSGGEE